MREKRNRHLLSDIIEHASYKENEYYLVSTDKCNPIPSRYQGPLSSFNSVLLHQCPKSEGVYDFTSKLHPPFRDPILPIELQFLQMCSVCGTPIPETIKTLWTLWNADCMSKEK